MSEMQPSRGRPRSTRAHQAVLEATRDLLGSAGYDQLTIEGIAAAAGVGRQTVYRWWPSKSAVVAEAVLAGYLSFGSEAPPSTGDLRKDLTGWFAGILELLREPSVVPLIHGLTAAAFEDRETRDRLFVQVTLPFRDAIRARMAGAQADGLIRADVNVDCATDTLVGMIFLRAMTSSRLSPEQDAEGLLDVFLLGVTPAEGR